MAVHVQMREGNASLVSLSNRGGEPIYYHGPHKLWIIAGGPQITIDFILKFYLYLITRYRGFIWQTVLGIEASGLSKYLSK